MEYSWKTVPHYVGTKTLQYQAVHSVLRPFWHSSASGGDTPNRKDWHLRRGRTSSVYSLSETQAPAKRSSSSCKRRSRLSASPSIKEGLCQKFNCVPGDLIAAAQEHYETSGKGCKPSSASQETFSIQVALSILPKSQVIDFKDVFDLSIL